jgi:acyl-CoA synthetase (AMP-forming)/AMP-acid ligase II
MDVAGAMRRAARYHARREAVVSGDLRFTFAEAWTRGLRMANALVSLGLEPGDRVASLEDNTEKAADFFLGAAIANLVRVPLYPRNSREAHRHMLGGTECRALIVDGVHEAEVEGIAGELPDLGHVVVRGEDYERWLAGFPDTDPEIPIDPDDNFIIRHTGGTTGLGKGVAYTHRSWLAAGRDWFYLYPPVEPGDGCLHVAPISHGSGYLFVPIWLSGGRNVLAERFHPTETIDLMERERIAYMFMVPTMLNVMNQDATARGRDWSGLKCILISAAPIADDTALTAREIFGDVLYQGYGQTEVLPIAMMGPRQWFAKVEGSEPLRSCGMPLPFAELEIWDEDNKPVLPGEPGQIVARTDGQMAGFWNDPEATKARIVDGWVLTGDIGRLDANGYLYMLDRSDDMIISGGYNIWPAELENAIADHPQVLEVAVFGVPHEKWGEAPMAVCVVGEGAGVSEDEIIALCAERLGSYKKPVAVEITREPLPKSPVGKIRRKELRDPHWAGHDRKVGGA